MYMYLRAVLANYCNDIITVLMRPSPYNTYSKAIIGPLMSIHQAIHGVNGSVNDWLIELAHLQAITLNMCLISMWPVEVLPRWPPEI